MLMIKCSVQCYMLVLSQENVSSRFLTGSDFNELAQLHSLPRVLKTLNENKFKGMVLSKRAL